MFNRTDGTRKLSRRQLLGGAGMAGAAGVVAANAASAAAGGLDDGSGWQGGVFRGMTSERTFIFRRASDGVAAEYALSNDARVFHGRPATLADFAEGEEMTVFVTLGDALPVVSEVEYLNRAVQATIDDRRGATLETDAGALEIVDDTRVIGGDSQAGELEAKPLTELADGDRVVAVGHRQPNSRTLDLSTVGVVLDG